MLDLIEAIYGVEVKEVGPNITDTIWYIKKGDTLESFITTLRFARECKKWADRKGYRILSDMDGAYASKKPEPIVDEDLDENTVLEEVDACAVPFECEFSSTTGNEGADVIMVTEIIAVNLK